MHASSDGGLLCVGEVRKLCMEGHLEAAVERLEEQRPLPRDMAYCFLQGICKTKTQDLHLLRRLHSLLIHNKLHSIPVLATHLIRLFASCGSLMEAEQVFSNVPKPAPHTWHAIISVNTKLGHGQKALHLYQKMRESNVESNPFLYSAVLKACADIGALLQGRIIHAQIVKSQLEFNLVIANNLVNMYAKCGSLDEANCVFYRMAHRDVVSWGAIIGGYAQHGIACHALELFQKMLQEGIKPDRPIFLNILKWLGIVRDLEQGRKIHCQIIQDGLERDVVVGNALVDMYVKCGNLGAARKAFDKMPRRDVVSWGVIIAGYAQHGHGLLALEKFEEMPHEGIKPDRVIFSSILKACGSIGAIEKGRLIHDQIIKEDLEADMYIGSTLVDMYAKCGSLLEAQEVFDRLPFRNIISWNVLISGYAKHGFHQEALKFLERMRVEGVSPNSVTFASILKACGNAGAIDKGRDIHLEIRQKGFERDLFVCNSLIDMYVKCGSLSEAQQVFNTQSVRDVVSWNALISGYAAYGHMQEALKRFELMQLEGILPDIVSWTVLIAGYAEHGLSQEALKCFKHTQLIGMSANPITFICSLKACGNIGAIEEGRGIHSMIAEKGLEKDPFVGNNLVDMYAKCGSVIEAREIFNKLQVQDAVTWTSIINGYAINLEVNMAIQCFLDMQQQGVKPNAIMFTCLLTVCSHAGLVSKGMEYFKMMKEEYGIVPTIDHFTCMVDLLARSGYLYEADKFLESMPYPPSIETWAALLSACKTYGKEELGLKCSQQIVQMNPQDAASYVVMANIYASSGRKDEAYRIEELRKHAGANKIPASAFIEVSKKVHEFVVGNNPSKEISAMLELLNSRVKEEGHVLNLEMVLGKFSDNEKEAAICEHAEKLALAFGLLNTPSGKTVHMTKNLRMCHNCHNVHKVISRIEMREIVVRDSYCVHHFKNGLCSCELVF